MIAGNCDAHIAGTSVKTGATRMAANRNGNLIWIDLEMTGLNPDTDRVLEIATIVTDPYLNLVAEGPVFAIHQKDIVLNAMDEWNTRQHGGSGLVDRVKRSTVDEARAEEGTLDFLRRFVDSGSSPMCGNSICQDRRFLWRHMPKLEAFFSLPQSGCQLHQGTGRALVPGSGARHAQEQHAPGAGRHSRFHQ
jgi:oligoribonuclease (3'-5' exoribonuclease)